MTPQEILALLTAAAAASQQIYQLIENAKAGTISPAQATASLNAFTSAITTDNAAADAALKTKFGGAE